MTPKHKQAKPAGDASQVLKVVARPASFRRCGRTFGPQPTYLPLSDLSEAELAALQAEPSLVTAIEDAPPAASEPGSA